MRKLMLFIAMSLDGYIADQNGGVDWLRGQDDSTEENTFYGVFEKNVDTVIMGWRTYHQIVTELSPEEWVYSNKKSYVITHKRYPSAENIHFVSINPCTLARTLKQEEGKDIWICGGADIIHQFMLENLIDQYSISIIPTILGNGIPLFRPAAQEMKLRLIQVKNHHGITELIYERR